MSASLIVISWQKLVNTPSVRKCRMIGELLFSKYLLATNISLSAGFSFTGDLLVQRYEIAKGKQKQWDSIRSMQVTVSGAVVGTVCHYWYQFLETRFPGRNAKSVLLKVFIDQIVCSPLYLSAFLATTCVLEGKSFAETREEFIQKGWRLYLADCLVWPPAQLINFYVLPLRFRVLFDNTVSLGFDVYTSYVKYEIPMVKS